MPVCVFCHYDDHPVDEQPCADCFRRAWEENDCWTHFEPEDDEADQSEEPDPDPNGGRQPRRKGAMRRWVR